MEVKRTPEERFTNLPGYDFKPHYLQIKAADGTDLRMHYLDEGGREQDGTLKTDECILCLHGQPSWSYLYRKMIPLLTEAGHRVIAPDLIGFGKSDKPTNRSDYTYSGHVNWLAQFIEQLDLTNITLVCQDWGGLLGLRYAGQDPQRFARLVIANTALPSTQTVTDELSAMMESFASSVPVPDASMVAAKFAEGAPDAFLYWVKYAGETPSFTPRAVFELLSGIQDEAILDAYGSPFPSEEYQAGARQFPSLVPLLPHHKEDREINEKAWAVLEKFDRPVLTAFADDDPVTAGGEVAFETRIPGAKGQPHTKISGGGHFLQEGKPAEFSKVINAFIAANPLKA